MIHYHGTPITPRDALYRLAGRCFCVPFSDPRDIAACREIGQALMLDNGAFSAWRKGKATDWPGFYGWVEEWLGPADFAVIPDVIDGGEPENDALVAQWPHGHRGAPVWHLHESFDRLRRLTDEWPLTCLGSSGEYSQIGTSRWERRMDAAFNLVCRRQFPPRLHGLRMLSLSDKRWPLASADSTDIARNHATERWKTIERRAFGWDMRNPPHRWTERPEQIGLFHVDSDALGDAVPARGDDDRRSSPGKASRQLAGRRSPRLEIGL